MKVENSSISYKCSEKRIMVSAFVGEKSSHISDEWMEWWTLLHCRLLVLQVGLFIGYGGGGGWGRIDEGSMVGNVHTLLGGEDSVEL